MIYGEERPIYIGLPADYDSTKAYPVIYTLDAEWTFETTQILAKKLALDDHIPAHIVIGVLNDGQEKRIRDLTFGPSYINGEGDLDSNTFFNREHTGGGFRFLSFLEDELAEYVKTLHKTNGFNLLIGHSLSGYFGSYALSKDAIFGGYILIDPSIWYDYPEALEGVRTLLTDDYTSNVFVSSATDGGKQSPYFLEKIQEFVSTLSMHKNVRLRHKRYTDEHHGSVVLPSILDGLKFIYDDYSFGYISVEDEVTAQDYIDHYKAFSKQLNFEFTPPVDGFRWIAYVNDFQRNYEQAVEAYALCIDNYMGDFMVVLGYAECLMELERWGESLKYLKIAQEINSEDPTVQLHIEKVSLELRK